MHKIWVSDDDNAIRVILEESLSSSGFDVKTFSSGDDIVNELKNAKPDLILSLQTFNCSTAAARYVSQAINSTFFPNSLYL